MYSEDNSFKRTLALTSAVTSNFFSITRNKKEKSYFLFDDENRLLLTCKLVKGNYCIFDIKNIQIAEIKKEGRRNNKFHKIYYLYFQKKNNQQIIGVHQNHNKELQQFNIPFVYDYSGLNSFRDLEHMELTDKTDKRRVILNSYPFQVPVNFEKHITSIKNSHYYHKNNLVFELVKESTNNFNIYLENPLSLVQGFMLALVNIRI